MKAVDVDCSRFSDFPDMVRISVCLPRKWIFSLSWTVDAYEGIGFVRTDDALKGIVSLFCPAEQEEEALALLKALRKEGIPLEMTERRGASSAQGTRGRSFEEREKKRVRNSQEEEWDGAGGMVE